MRVLVITGSRSLTANEASRAGLFDVVRNEARFSGHLIVGDATGADDLAFRCWERLRQLGVTKLLPFVFPAYWDDLGRRAGPVRNEAMVRAAAGIARAYGSDLVAHAYPKGESRGTRGCIKLLAAHGAEVIVHEVTP